MSETVYRPSALPVCGALTGSAGSLTKIKASSWGHWILVASGGRIMTKTSASGRAPYVHAHSTSDGWICTIREGYRPRDCAGQGAPRERHRGYGIPAALGPFNGGVCDRKCI